MSIWNKLFVGNLFKSPEYREYNSPEQVKQLREVAQERRTTAKLTSKGIEQDIKILQSNLDIYKSNLKLVGADAKVKTQAAIATGKTVDGMAKLAPQYAEGKMQIQSSDERAKNDVQQLAASYGNKYSDIGHSYGQPTGNSSDSRKGLPGF